MEDITDLSAKLEEAKQARQEQDMPVSERQNGTRPDPVTQAKQTLAQDRQRRLQQARQVMERCQAELAELGCELGVSPVYVPGEGGQLQPVTLGQIQLRVVDG